MGRSFVGAVDPAEEMSEDRYFLMRESGQRRSVYFFGCGEQLLHHSPAFRLEPTENLAPIDIVPNPPNQPVSLQSVD